MQREELAALFGWLVTGYAFPLAIGLIASHWIFRTQPGWADRAEPMWSRILVWATTPAVSWSLATMLSHRFVGMVNLVELPVLASIVLGGYWWPLYWPERGWPEIRERRWSLREIVMLIAVNGLTVLMGLFTPSSV